MLVVAILAVTFAAGTLMNRDQPVASGPAATTTTTRRPTTTTEPNTATTPPTTDDTPSTQPRSGSGSGIDEDELNATVIEIQTFVEKSRGHEFKDPVDVKVLERSEFEARVLESFEAETDALREEGDLLKALGLIPADLDIVETQRKLMGGGVLGFYDPDTKELVVGGDHIGPFLREVLAHELTHALDDQWFDLNREVLDGTDDGTDWAFLALVEGSAKRVENDYVDAMSDADRRQLEEEEMELGMDQLDAMLTTPMVLARLALAPYDYGEPFVRALVDEHGIAGLDAAFGAPPTTSEQVLHNDKFDALEPAIAVPTPGTDGVAQDDGVLGELMTAIVLAGGGGDPLGALGTMTPEELDELLDKIMNGEISPEELEELLGGGEIGGPTLGSSGLSDVETIPGWGGDRYVTWHSETQGVCVRIAWKMDTAAALLDMRAALDAWKQADAGVLAIEAPADDIVQAIRCSGPASSTPDGPTTPSTPSTRPPRTTPPTTTTA